MKKFRKIIKPTAHILKPNFDGISEKLKAYPYWGVWNGVPKEGGISKPPTNPKTGQLAKVNDPKTFSSFAVAKTAYETGKYDGIGILVIKRATNSILGVDLDDCLSDGQLSDVGICIVDRLRTYTEISPCGKGIRCLGFTKTPISLERCKRDKIELYIYNRFLTVTGERWNSNDLRYCPNAFKEIHEKYIANPRAPKKDYTLDSLIDSPLFLGDISDYKSQSEADLALCRQIYRSGIKDPDEIDRKFRESQLYDKKWDRPDYSDRTILKAIELEQSSLYAYKGEIELLDTKKMISTPPPEINWVIRDLIPKGQIGEMIGDGKIGKSSLLVQMAIAIASGISKEPFVVDAPQRVLLINVEDPQEQIHSKIFNQSKDFEGIDEQLLVTNLKVADGLGKIGPLMNLDQGKTPVQSEYGRQLEELIRKVKPDLVILDTKSRLYGLEENNNDHATQWLFQLEKIALEEKCSFLIAHHTAKLPGRRITGSKITGRGASAFDNNTRFRITLSPVDQNYANKYNLVEDKLDSYFQMTTQSNYSAKSKILYFRRGEAGVPILMNLAEQRWYKAGEMLLELLRGKDIRRQQLIRNETDIAKAIRGSLHEAHKITAKECGILLDNLEKEKKISYEGARRGKGKIIVHGIDMK